jgi:hypothetical protein
MESADDPAACLVESRFLVMSTTDVETLMPKSQGACGGARYGT